jgi:anti-anti-sigma regulatory factor
MRITNVPSDGDSITLKVEGRISGPWAAVLRRAFEDARRQTSARLTLDLTSVSFIDAAGKQVLKDICGCGAEFVAAGCHTRSVIEDITR